MSTFVSVHVALSLIGIVTGLLVLIAMIQGRRPSALTAVFLAATILTSVTGFPIPPLVAFIALGVLAFRRFHPAPARSMPNTRTAA